MWIVGSRAVQLYFTQLRTAGAQVRKVLIANAAQKWGVDPATLPAVDPKELKDRKDFRLIGKSVPRRDTPLKVNGTAQYAIDVKLPGMLAVIPSLPSRKVPIPHDANLYKNRNRIERCFNKLKHFRRFATRFDRRAAHFLAFIHLAWTPVRCRTAQV